MCVGRMATVSAVSHLVLEPFGIMAEVRRDDTEADETV